MVGLTPLVLQVCGGHNGHVRLLMRGYFKDYNPKAWICEDRRSKGGFDKSMSALMCFVHIGALFLCMSMVLFRSSDSNRLEQPCLRSRSFGQTHRGQNDHRRIAKLLLKNGINAARRKDTCKDYQRLVVWRRSPQIENPKNHPFHQFHPFFRKLH